MTVVSPPQLLGPAANPVARRGHDHIIDILIAERAPKLAASPLWPLARPALYALLDYAKARRMADAIAPLSGRAALDHVSDLLSLDVHPRGLARLPASGRLIVVCNHPTGIGDGIAVFDALKTVRSDLVFLGNADAERVSPNIADILIPVEWVAAKRTLARTRETLLATKAAMEAERCLVVFPAGRIARAQPGGGLLDPPWTTSAVSLAQRYGAPILPIHVAGPWSTLFHLFHRLSPELRDVTLFHELLNKRGRRFDLTVGPLIPLEAVAGDPNPMTLALKAHVEQGLAADPDRAFP